MKVQINSQKGFTLIEILVVMFICALALIPAFYSWQQQQQKLRLIDAARQVAVFIYGHLMESIYLNQHRILSVTVAAKDWQLAVKEAGGFKPISVMHGEQFEDVEIVSATRLTVDMYGKQGTSHAFRIVLKNEFGRISVVMSAIGRIRGCSDKKIVGIPRC